MAKREIILTQSKLSDRWMLAVGNKVVFLTKLELDYLKSLVCK